MCCFFLHDFSGAWPFLHELIQIRQKQRYHILIRCFCTNILKKKMIESVQIVPLFTKKLSSEIGGLVTSIVLSYAWLLGYKRSANILLIRDSCYGEAVSNSYIDPRKLSNWFNGSCTDRADMTSLLCMLTFRFEKDRDTIWSGCPVKCMFETFFGLFRTNCIKIEQGRTGIMKNNTL